jgi:hypothetical protein
MKLQKKAKFERGDSPYFECTPEQWEEYTKYMTEQGKRSLGNALAHSFLLAKRYENGWLLTRHDLIEDVVAGRRKYPWAFVPNDGRTIYAYDPTTGEREKA